MRERLLYNSVRAQLGDDEKIMNIVHMWTRHRYFFPFVLSAALLLFAVSLAVEIEQWSGRFGLGLGGAAAGAMAATDYRILVQTQSDLVMMRSSKIRRKATGLISRLPLTTPIKPVGSNVVITDWQIGDSTYSVMKRFQSAIVAIAQP